MKFTTSDKVIAYLTLVSGLTISAVAVWYSVAGLVSIFAASVVPIIVMGVALEVSKLIATVWLKLNWNRAPNLIKLYLCTAIAILMVITSMGIFGFLSKAHSDQTLVSGDVQSRIAVIDEKIATEKENMDAARKALAQLDAGVNETLSRSSSEQGANRAVQIRRQQAKERAALQKEISTAQANIAKLNEEAAPIRAEVRKVEAEVGPIKYIAAFVYGDNPDANLLEKAVTWVIIIIVSVFDPLAVILLLASQYSFQWFRQQKEDQENPAPKKEEPTIPADDNFKFLADYDELNGVVAQPVAEVLPEAVVESRPEVKFEADIAKDQFWSFDKPTEVVDYQVVEDADDELDIPVLENEEMWAQRVIDEEHDEIESVTTSEKAAMQKWKIENPDKSIKYYRKLYEKGLIDSLPWQDVEPLERPGDYLTESDAPKKTVEWMENVDGHQVKRHIEGYVQNAEQGNGTLWQKVHNAKGNE